MDKIDSHIYKNSLHRLFSNLGLSHGHSPCSRKALPLVRLIEPYPLATNQSICSKNMAEPFSYSDRSADMGDKTSMSGL